ncbi:unnamed protein product [marine sediment metagenome]|uniref:LamG-like jellyroll fold domain-containing protein n=1 Tax=marine sediment metagenome TaxID=412755 RepID=X0Z1V1_9ZZZZ
MKSTGLVYEMRRYTGKATPPLTVLEDASIYGSDGDFKSSGHPAWVKNAAGIWELGFDSAAIDYVEITCPQCNFTFEDFSIIVRFTEGTLDVIDVLFIRGISGSDGYSFHLAENGEARFQTFQVAVSQLTSTAAGAIVNGGIYTLGLSRSGEDVFIYRNGIDITSVSGTHINPLTCARTAKIGVWDTKNQYGFDGKMSYMGVWGYALSAEAHAAKHQELSRWG